MNNKKNKKIYSLYIIYGSIFTVVLAIIVTMFIFAQKQKDYSVLINITGRQRMLTQTLLKDLIVYDEKKVGLLNINKTINLFEDTMKSLVHGGIIPVGIATQRVQKIPPIKSEKILTKIKIINKNWNVYKEKITKYIENKNTVSISKLSDKSHKILFGIDRVVLDLQHDAEESNFYLRMFLLISIFFILIILGASLYFYVKQLGEATEQIKILEKILPICSNCKKIRIESDDKDHQHWVPIESYLRKENDMSFSHGMCDDCVKKLYPDLYDKIIEE